MSKEKKQLHSLSLEELRVRVGELDGELFKLRLQKTTGQLGNTAQLRYGRKELARVKTVIGEKLRATTRAAK